MDGHHAVGHEMAAVKVHRLAGQQVRGNRVAAEGVDHQEIEPLRLFGRQFGFQGQSGIAHHQVPRLAAGSRSGRKSAAGPCGRPTSGLIS